MSKNTPGPWSYWRSGKVIEVKAINDKMAVVPWMAFDDNARPLTVHDANARLIAAAPDLLEALQEGLEVSKYAAAINFDGSPNTIEWCYDLYQKLDYFQKIAAAAIEKAEGAK